MLVAAVSAHVAVGRQPILVCFCSWSRERQRETDQVQTWFVVDCVWVGAASPWFGPAEAMKRERQRPVESPYIAGERCR